MNVKEPTHLSKRAERAVSDVVVWTHLTALQRVNPIASPLLDRIVQENYYDYDYELQSWTKVLGQICTFGAFAHMPDANKTSFA